MAIPFQSGDALLIVDAQKDFFPSGALGVPHSDNIIPIVNEYIAQAQASEIPIVLSRDWHPENHRSFKENGGPWPKHCVQNEAGAEFHPDVIIPAGAIIVNKAFEVDKEVYSVFEGMTVDGQHPVELLKDLGVKRIWIGGLALDFCVKATALDGIKAGFEIQVRKDATYAIDVEHQDEVIAELSAAGVIFS